MQFAIRVDASPLVGGGHAMRCLTLADELKARGGEVLFVCASLLPSLAALIEEKGHRLVSIAAGERADGENWDRASWPEHEQRDDVARTVAVLVPSPVQWLIVDHYGLDRCWEAAMKQHGPRLLVIDDLANRPHDCDLLLDHNLGRRAADYRELVPEACRLLIGPQYALLRADFARARPAALARRRQEAPIRRLLVSLGMTDPAGVTLRLLEDLCEQATPFVIDVTLGSSSPCLAAVANLADAAPRIHLHVDHSAMSDLMEAADLAVGAAGTSSWERCCLGLPAVTAILADNQRLVASSLDRAGAVLAVADHDRLGDAVLALAEDGSARLRMSAAAAAIVDGQGAPRVADALHGHGPERRLSLRPAQAEDSEALWLWRNDPGTRAMSRSPEPIAWPDHARWFERAVAAGRHHIMIAEDAETALGMVRFDRLSANTGYEVSINLAPAARGQGFGAQLLQSACALPPYRHATLLAMIADGNPASGRIFEAAGFVATATVDSQGFRRYERPPGETA